MKGDVSGRDAIGNDLSFPVRGKKKYRKPVSARRLLVTFLLGYLLIIAVTMGIRCSFYFNAGFADGAVVDLKKAQRRYSYKPQIMFATGEGISITFPAADNLRLQSGERVRVIYKKHNPSRAAVYSLFGFWFNAVIICQVAMLFWIGLLIVYYGDYP